MIKEYTFKRPPLQKLPDKSNMALWTSKCDWNRKSIMVWNSRFFPVISEGEPVYEYKYNVKAIFIGVEDWGFIKSNLHPMDFGRYAPSLDEKITVGKCLVDTDKLYKRIPLLDTEFAEDLEFRLMEDDGWQLG